LRYRRHRDLALFPTRRSSDLGTLTPKPVVLEELEAGDVGFVVANIKRVADARVGDTLIEADRPAPPLPGFEAIKPMVFAGLYPVDRKSTRLNSSHGSISYAVF